MITFCQIYGWRGEAPYELLVGITGVRRDENEQSCHCQQLQGGTFHACLPLHSKSEVIVLLLTIIAQAGTEELALPVFPETTRE